LLSVRDLVSSFFLALSFLVSFSVSLTVSFSPQFLFLLPRIASPERPPRIPEHPDQRIHPRDVLPQIRLLRSTFSTQFTQAEAESRVERQMKRFVTQEAASERACLLINLLVFVFCRLLAPLLAHLFPRLLVFLLGESAKLQTGCRLRFWSGRAFAAPRPVLPRIGAAVARVVRIIFAAATTT
jgi:hypothetical protein